jgi:uncharacterized protein (DUF2336 family)
MTFSDQSSRFTLLTELSKESSSEDRRELLRRATEALGSANHAGSESELAEFDEILAAAAADYSTQVRAQIARLVAGAAAPFSQAAQRFAMDDHIDVARPVLESATCLSEATLLKVIGQKSQDHMLAVTRRATVSPVISHALVEKGNDAVVTSLLKNERAEIAPATYDVVVRRTETSPALQAPLVRRATVPVELLNGLYMKVESDLRKEIVAKFESVSPEEMEKAFQRSRDRVSDVYKQRPDDFSASLQRLTVLEQRGSLQPPVLISLLREGKSARTTFKLVFARLTDVDFDLVERIVETFDLDTVALLCRGSNFDRALFVSLAVGLDDPSRGLAGADQFAKLYESVPVQAAQRAIRFWKVRAAA